MYISRFNRRWDEVVMAVRGERESRKVVFNRWDEEVMAVRGEGESRKVVFNRSLL